MGKKLVKLKSVWWDGCVEIEIDWDKVYAAMPNPHGQGWYFLIESNAGGVISV